MDWDSIHDHLTSNGFKVNSLGQHKGQCTSPYIVLRNNGTTEHQSLDYIEYELLLYFPFARYRKFEEYIQNVRKTMGTLYPALRLVDGPSSHYLDDDVQGYMTSLIYRKKTIITINRPV